MLIQDETSGHTPVNKLQWGLVIQKGNLWQFCSLLTL